MSSSITPLTTAGRLAEMSDIDIGRYASGGYGVDKQKQFLADLRHVCKLAKKAEEASARGWLRDVVGRDAV